MRGGGGGRGGLTVTERNGEPGTERDTTYHDLKGLLTVAIFGHPSGTSRSTSGGTRKQ